MKSPTIVTTSWDDGARFDFKLGDILNKHDIKATFYIAPYNKDREVMNSSEVRVLSDNFEIGGHSLTHPDLSQLDCRSLECEIAGCKSELESIIGKPVRMFCYPKGVYSKRIITQVKAAGFSGARKATMFSTALARNRWLMPTSMMCKPTPSWTWFPNALRRVNSNTIKNLFLAGGHRDWSKIACKLFDSVLKNGGVWHLWGHSWEIEMYNQWSDLETVLKHVSNHPGAIYLTNGDLNLM